MNGTQLLFLIIASGIALFQVIVFWIIFTVTDEMPHIRKADHFDGEIEHG